MHKHKNNYDNKICIDHMIMHCCIIIYNMKQLNWFEGNNLNYLNCNGNVFNNDYCDFKVTIVVEM